MDNRKTDDKDKGSSSYSHLKWPSIIIAFLVILLIIFMDYCTRTGQI